MRTRKPSKSATRKKPAQQPPDEIAAWYRRPNEGARAYAAFLVYRDLGPQRSLTRAWKIYRDRNRASIGHQEGIEPASVPGHFRRWCRLNHWATRVEAWDKHLRSVEESQCESLALHARKFRFERLLDTRVVYSRILEKLATRLDAVLEPPANGDLADIPRQLPAFIRELRSLESDLRFGFPGRLTW